MTLLFIYKIFSLVFHKACKRGGLAYVEVESSCRHSTTTRERTVTEHKPNPDEKKYKQVDLLRTLTWTAAFLELIHKHFQLVRLPHSINNYNKHAIQSIILKEGIDAKIQEWILVPWLEAATSKWTREWRLTRLKILRRKIMSRSPACAVMGKAA